MDRDQVAALIAQLGGEIGIPSLALDADGSCTLFIDDGGVIVSLGHNTVTGSIDLMVCLDAVEPAAVPLNLLLQANFAWRGSRGATFAIEPASGALVLQRRVTAADGAELRQALEELIDAAEAWSKRLASDVAPAAQAEPATMGIRA